MSDCVDVEDAEVLRHLRALDRWQPEPWPRLTDSERDDVHERLEVLSSGRGTRVAVHRRTLVRQARRLGRMLGAGEVTLDAAVRQLDGLLGAFDPESFVPIVLVPYEDAHLIVLDGLRVGVREARA